MTMKNPDLHAILTIGPQQLAQVLSIPEGCEIDGLDCPFDSPGALHVRVRGMGWVAIPGQRIQSAIGIVKPIASRIEWTLPE